MELFAVDYCCCGSIAQAFQRVESYGIFSHIHVLYVTHRSHILEIDQIDFKCQNDSNKSDNDDDKTSLWILCFHLIPHANLL